MQRAFPIAGKVQCRYCGEPVPFKSLTMHILKNHPRPARSNVTPTLVRKPVAGLKATVE